MAESQRRDLPRSSGCRTHHPFARKHDIIWNRAALVSRTTTGVIGGPAARYLVTQDEYEHARKLAAQIAMEKDEGKFYQLLFELKDFLEQIELRTHPKPKAS